MSPLLALPACPLPADAVEMGYIGAPWGIKGWFKVAAFSPQPDTLLQARQWHVQPGGQRHSPHGAAPACLLLSIAGVRTFSRGVAATSSAIADRTAAEALRGARIFMPRSDFAPPPADEYYWVDLLGAAVVNRQGVPLGRVKNLLGSGAQTTLVLTRPASARECLIPFVAAYIDRVDLPAKTIVADWQADWDL